MELKYAPVPVGSNEVMTVGWWKFDHGYCVELAFYSENRYLEPREALDLLNWLSQEREMIEQLAKEEQ